MTQYRVRVYTADMIDIDVDDAETPEQAAENAFKETQAAVDRGVIKAPPTYEIQGAVVDPISPATGKPDVERSIWVDGSGQRCIDIGSIMPALLMAARFIDPAERLAAAGRVVELARQSLGLEVK